MHLLGRLRRRWSLAPITLVMLLSWLGVLLALGQARAVDRGDLAASLAVRPDLSGVVGVNLEVAELMRPGAEGELTRLAEAGIRWVRFTIPWDQVEPVRGQFAWEAWDRVFALLRRVEDLEPLVVLDRSPGWARAAADAANPAAPPHERSDFGAFAAALARRYGGQVRYYQLWHEPNIAPHWGVRGPDPADYMGLLREGAIHIRSVDPDALIVLAALAPTTESGGQNLSDLAYLAELYRLGARAWFDIVAGQPYGFSEGTDAPASPDRLNFARVELLRQVMLRYGDGVTPIWATAFGWNALPAGWSGPPSPWGQVSEEAQARNLSAAIELSATRWSWLGPLFWAAACPPRAPDDPWIGFALCAPGGETRPVWDALLQGARRPAVLPIGDHAPDHAALRYSAGWRVTAEAADPPQEDAALAFTFYGSGLSLRVQGGPYWALYRVAVDGAPANALPRDEAGQSYLVLYDPDSAVRVVPVARGLPLGRHEVVLHASGGWGQWALQGILVSGEHIVSRGWTEGLVLLLAVAVTGAWVALVWPVRRQVAGRLVALRDGVVRSVPEPLVWGAAMALAVGLALSRWLPADLVLCAALGTVFLLRPDVSLPLIAAAIPFWAAPRPIAGRELAVYELLLWLATAAFIAYQLIDVTVARGGSALPERVMSAGKRATLRSSGSWLLGWRRYALDGPVAFLVVAALLSAVFAREQGVAWREFRLVFLDGALFYWLVTRVRVPRGRAFSPWPLVNGLLAGMLAASLLGLWQLVTGQGRVEVEGVWRVRALYGSPNNLALVLDRAVPIALALAAFGPGGRRRLAYAAVALIGLVACVATFSKGALLLGLPVGIGLVLLGGAWRARQRWPVGLAALLGALGLAGIGLLLRTPRFAGLFDFGSGTSFFRLKLWQSAWQMAREHPVLGVGPDNFLYAYRTRYVLPSAWQELNLSHPHNILLDMWTRLGIVGVVATTWAVASVAGHGWRLFRTAGPSLWPLALGLLAALAATLAHGLIDNSLFLADLMAIFMMTAGSLGRLEAE